MLLAAMLAGLMACSQTKPDTNTAPKPLPGVWEFSYDLGQVAHVQTVEINPQNEFIFFNATEAITSERVELVGDTLRIHMPIYGTYLDFTELSDTSMVGHWINPSRTDYRVPVRATRGSREHHLPAPSGADTLTYACTFSEGTEDAYPAEGLFTLNGSNLYATFRTETGDYRFLEGTPSNGQWKFGCFDGSHLFQFTAEVKGDSISGTFYSGTHWSEPFTGIRTLGSVLRDPFTITYVVNDSLIQPKIINANSEVSALSADYFTGKTHIVHILGTWCPNCLDESRYLSELSKKYGEDQLSITGFAFERRTTDSLRIAGIERYRKQTGITYPIYLSGDAAKGQASDMFNMLNGITSFPTTLIIDKYGNIALVHTGFNGPGTGAHYTSFRRRFETALDSLVALP